ncbi:MAG: metallopeptidase family protein [Hyphomicrobiales bacterium]|nr:metallopeptidase family protein [Hyphomicrobiales bacterium]
MGERIKSTVIGGVDWSRLEAPDAETFIALAYDAFFRLPAEFRRLCSELIIRIEDFPDLDEIEEMGLDSEFDLLGLFTGTGLTEGGPGQWTGQMPNMVTLYRRPILDYWAEHEETLGAVITHVLVHEIGHHFGLTDDDMDRIEASAE